MMLLVAALGGGASLAAFAAWKLRTLPATPLSRPLEIIASGDTAGWIMPCGCSAHQSGGLARRGAYVNRSRDKGDVLVVDVGGAAGGSSPYDRMKFAAILRGEAELGTAAHNLGGAELAFGPAELRVLAQESGVPFVSANVRDTEDKPLFPPLRVISIGARRVVVVGVVSPQFAKVTYRVTDPRASILAALATVPEKSSAIVVLAYLPAEELLALAKELPEVDLLIGGPTRQSIAPQSIGPTMVAAVTNKGKFLAHFRGPASDADRWSGTIVEMDDKVPDDPDQVQILAQFQRALVDRDFAASETSFAPALQRDLPAGYQVAGVEACRSCHRDDCRSWDQTAHARAWQTLVDRGVEGDSYCQQCHTTAFGLPGGFVSARRSLTRTAVGCESCHGPAREHVEQPRAKTYFVAHDQCLRCHDRENNPDFAYAAAWKEIEHGVAAQDTKVRNLKARDLEQQPIGPVQEELR
jgi:hypothetical protein